MPDVRARPDFLRQAIALLRQGRPAPEIWLLALFVLAITTYAELTTVPPPGLRAGPAFMAAAALRVVLVIWLVCAVLRSTAAKAPVLWPGLALARMTLPYVLLGVVVPGVAVVAARRLVPVPDTVADQWLMLFLASLAAQLVTLRLLGWLAALAAGDPIGPRAIWVGLRGATLPLVRAFLVLVAPFLALHIAFTLILSDGWVQTGPGLVALLAADTLVSTLQLGLGAILAVLAWAVARERTAALEERPSTRR
jgi:hypothetical protein